MTIANTCLVVIMVANARAPNVRIVYEMKNWLAIATYIITTDMLYFFISFYDIHKQSKEKVLHIKIY